MSSVDDSSKPKLIPVKVPWKISLSTPFLTLTVNEFEPSTVEFLARFKPVGYDNEDERVVTVTFTGFWRFRGVSARDEERPPIDESAYDWSEVLIPPLKVELFNDWVVQFNKEWQVSQICPDPGMYEVRNSDWALLAQSDEYDCRHFLLVGEEKCVEVLARSWTWEVQKLK